MLGDEKLKDIVDNASCTPFFLMDIEELKKRTLKIKSILNGGNNKIGLCYSIKANPLLIPYLSDVVDMYEACSPGELYLCEHYNVPGNMIIYSGVQKGEADIKDAISYGAKIITVESIRHYDLIKKALSKLEKNLCVILRLSSQSQFGMSKEDTEYIIQDSQNIKDKIDIIGLHYFAGTQREKLKYQQKELEQINEVFHELRERYTIPLRWFEYGPGLAYPYFKDDNFSDTLAPVSDLSDSLYKISEDTELMVEMGRFIASSCGYYFTRVCDKKQSFDRNWCILDGGINHVNYYGQMMGMQSPVIRILSNTDKSGPKKGWALCGSLCTMNDVLVRNYDMHEPDIGDVLVFCNIGAYSITEALNLFLSRDMPAVFAYENGDIVKIRDRIETWKLNSASRT